MRCQNAHLFKYLLQAHDPEPMDEEQQRALPAGCLGASAPAAIGQVRRSAAAPQRGWKRDPPGTHSGKAWVSPSPCPKSSMWMEMWLLATNFQTLRHLLKTHNRPLTGRVQIEPLLLIFPGWCLGHWSVGPSGCPGWRSFQRPEDHVSVSPASTFLETGQREAHPLHLYVYSQNIQRSGWVYHFHSNVLMRQSQYGRLKLI